MHLRIFAQLSSRKKIALVAAFSICLIGSLVFLVIVPAMEEIKTVKIETETWRLALEKDYEKGKNLRKLAESLKIVEPQLPELEKVFIQKDPDNQLKFVMALEKAAEKAGVSQKINLAASQPCTPAVCQKTPLYLSTTGSFKRQMDFLLSLESLNYYINIKSLEITQLSPAQDVPGNGNADTGTVSVQIIADTYWKDKN